MAKDPGRRPGFSVLPPGCRWASALLWRGWGRCVPIVRSGRAELCCISGCQVCFSREEGSRDSSTVRSGGAWHRLVETEPRDPLGCPVLAWVEMVCRWGHNTGKLDSPSQQSQRAISQRSPELRRRREPRVLAQFCYHVVTDPLSCASFALNSLGCLLMLKLSNNTKASLICLLVTNRWKGMVIGK